MSPLIFPGNRGIPVGPSPVPVGTGHHDTHRGGERAAVSTPAALEKLRNREDARKKPTQPKPLFSRGPAKTNGVRCNCKKTASRNKTSQIFWNIFGKARENVSVQITVAFYLVIQAAWFCVCFGFGRNTKQAIKTSVPSARKIHCFLR